MAPLSAALPASVGPGPRKVPRRALLASAAAAVALGGCARPDRLLETVGVPTPLHVHVIGLPADQAADLVAGVRACQAAYANAHRGRVTLEVTTSLVPDSARYRVYCPIPGNPTQRCRAAAYPATPAQADPLAVSGGAALGQIGLDGIPLWLARGRTGLDILFGDTGLLPPVLTDLETPWPDIIIGYDIWQYWLAPLAADLEAQWKVTTDARDGLPPNFDRHGRFFAPGHGTFVAAYPLLRNPMMIENVDPVTPWTWAQVISALDAPPASEPGARWDTSRFRRSLLYPDATEWAAAMVAGSGGQLATMTGGFPPVAAFASPAAELGVRWAAEVIAAGPPLADPSAGALIYPVGVKHMFTVFGGTSQGYSMGGLPWPAGPVRTAVPCTYLCATVVALGKRVQAAQDFASLLMHPAAQTELARWKGGLALRPEQALPRVPGVFPNMAADLAEVLVSGANDLTSSDLYGGEKTVANATVYDSAADWFAAALAAIPSAGTDPGRIAAVLTEAAKSSGS